MNFDEAKQFVQKRFLMIDEKLLYDALIYSDEDEVGLKKMMNSIIYITH